MAKFLLLSKDGDGLGLALRLKEQGHEVASWVKSKRSKANYGGLIKKVESWENFLDKETIVLFDSTGGGKTADRLRARGHHVFVGSTFADQLEEDRTLAFDLLNQVGVRTPRSETFFDWEAGKNYAARFEGRLVFKAAGELADQDGIGSYVGQEAEDLIGMLSYYESIATKPCEFVLQEFIEGGVCVSSEGWFNGEEFVWPFNHTFERKQLMPGDLGPSGGCAGNVVFKVDDRYNHIIDEGIARTASILAEHEYIGPCDLNTVCTEKGVYALEFTPRFGYDAMPAFLELFQGDLGEFISKMARKERPKEMVLAGGYASALRLTIPPYPSDEYKPTPGVPIGGFERTDRAHLYFYDIMLSPERKIVSSPGYGTVAAITGTGDTILEAFEGPLEIAKRARVPRKQYRTDLHEVLQKDEASWRRLMQLRQSHGSGQGYSGVPGSAV